MLTALPDERSQVPSQVVHSPGNDCISGRIADHNWSLIWTGTGFSSRPGDLSRTGPWRARRWSVRRPCSTGRRPRCDPGAVAPTPVTWNSSVSQPSFAEIGEQPIPLGVDVRPDVVGDLAGAVAQTDAPVVGHRADPEGHARPVRSSVDFQNRTWWRWLALSPTGFSKARSCLRPKTNRVLTGAST